MQHSAVYCNQYKVCAGCSKLRAGKNVAVSIIIKKTAPNSTLLCETCRKINLLARKVKPKNALINMYPELSSLAFSPTIYNMYVYIFFRNLYLVIFGYGVCRVRPVSA